MKEMNFTVGEGKGIISTLVSIVPFPIREFKPGLFPGTFHIEPCFDENNPVCIPIGESFHFVYIDAERGNLRVLDPSYDVCRAIVSDYNSAQLESGPTRHPGLFWLPGEWTAELIRKDKEASAKLEEIKKIQAEWFISLVRLGDDDWERSRQHQTISDTQRYAARSIDPTNKQNRQWIFVDPKNSVIAETSICPACGSDVLKTAVVCRYCKFVLDEDKYSQMKFAADIDLKAVVNRAR
jgi:hypothetical protein